MENTTTKQVETADKVELLAAFAAKQDAIALGWAQYRRLVSAYTYRMLVVETFTHHGQDTSDITPHLLCSASRKPWFVVANPYYNENEPIMGDSRDEAYLPCRFQDLDLTIMRVVAGLLCSTIERLGR